ncbi:DMT family transporter [Salimicrobium flavidum]|uniref:Transporter family-2 protein n=1 Tax=Salimicrobium flavidum TaxID=570947 RepID=A0A1N7JJK7_9BACI|nr:DMT family transporter [Salimicrobium flavidum]SIS49518.1 transporter family-2 protein [Salimicrobium flavidum]
MIGVLFSILAGVLISTQNIFNTRMSGKIGSWGTTTVVLGLGLVASLIVFFIVDDTPLFALGGINPIFLFSGVFGVTLVYCLMRGMAILGPAYTVSITMVSQLAVASVVDTFGLFHFEPVPFTWTKALGLSILVVGILVFKLGHRLPVFQKRTKSEEAYVQEAR